MSVLPFGQLPDGTAISEIRLTTAAGASASIITRGATVRDLAVPLPNGEMRRVVLGYPTLDGYLADTSYLGQLIKEMEHPYAPQRTKQPSSGCRL